MEKIHLVMYWFIDTPQNISSKLKSLFNFISDKLLIYFLHSITQFKNTTVYPLPNLKKFQLEFRTDFLNHN